LTSPRLEAAHTRLCTRFFVARAHRRDEGYASAPVIRKSPACLRPVRPTRHTVLLHARWKLLPNLAYCDNSPSAATAVCLLMTDM